MTLLQKLLVLAVPLLLLALTAIAGYSYSQIRFLSLPISQALGLFTVILPLITGISTQGAYGLIQRSSKKDNYHLTIPLIVVIGFQLIYEIIVATLAMTYVLPPSSLACGLDQMWQFLYSNKNAKAIRAIQDAFECCGFKTVVDRAFPFSGGRSECAAVFGRDKSCLGEWRKAEQTHAGLFVIVALVVFLIKAVSIISLLTSTTWEQSWAHPFRRHVNGDVEDPEEDNRADMRRLIEGGDRHQESRDEPAEGHTGRAIEAPSGDDQSQGPRVQPSSLLDTGNEWRNEGGQH
ncbi:hypothetical protein D0Z07_3227 [Hyphodiscus hymeniophilus]|uniref:Tetraspanin Tsp3 n=1 Tax=Hyphodiscus hymeniophilus TaxID=353542 RepID=A0A9P6VKS7_9HELO|nr:hypothetical protein D0Z07_3227 [Hyphodiscus hymeniophilus]